ncbi:MAG: FAD-binding oxidoreductase [Melioribacteraceae bacterium]|nr:FAD-binding oxidoreductase [Melioribacteraceae bacterium]
MLSGKYYDLYSELKKVIPSERIFIDELRTLAYGTDASFYRLIPKIVVRAANEIEAQKIISFCNSFEIPITFRAAGTSLSGQAISDSVILQLDRSWNNYNISENSKEIKMQPALVGGFANLYLAQFHKKIGPDPASINSSMISGIASNNASGMTSGIAKNTYNTLKSLRIIFQDGTILDTSDELSKVEFQKNNSEFIESIKKLSAEVKGNEKLTGKIKKKFDIKNTTGYGINSLIDFDDPFEIISHLMIGSEGTLGFISEITLKTVDDPPYKATSLILFKDIKSACDAIPIFKELPVAASEIMDRAALKSVEDIDGMPAYLKELNENAAALLVETNAFDENQLKIQIDQIIHSIDHLAKERKVEFTTDKNEYKKLWDVRKGLFPTVCKSRRNGTTVIIEDLNFPTSDLADAVLDLQQLFKKYNYDEAIIWGHSLSGNIHFVISQDFADPNEIERYKNFMNEITDLVVDKYDGSLKAEHGTGRNMAPFVKKEWGEDAYQLMKEIKKLFDPKNILNPGVIINEDEEIHLKNLKPLPEANPIIDKCIECGFCEVNCPSKDVTLTPRQRITAWREINQRKKNSSQHLELNSLLSDYDYLGNETCATDGLCATSCPVDIDTGKLIKEIRSEKISHSAEFTADFIARNFSIISRSAKHGLNFVHLFHKLLGTDTLNYLSNSLSNISKGLIPHWNEAMPKGADYPLPNLSLSSDLKVVYFPSCISRSFGLQKETNEKYSQTYITLKLLNKAGYEVLYPTKIDSLCCGMPFSSKGFIKQADYKSDELLTTLIEKSENGKYPILFDTSPCLYRMKEYMQKAKKELKIYEPIEFILEHLVDKLNFKKVEDVITIHTTCSSTKMGLTEKFEKLAKLCTDNVIIPKEVGCCGFAGDRGFTFPELNKSALRNLKSSLPENCTEGYSTSKTCEIGLSLHSGIEYKSIVYLVDKVTD